MTYRIKYTKQFEKDIKQAAKRGKNLDKLFAIINKLAAGEPLDPKNRVHLLVGEYSAIGNVILSPIGCLFMKNLTIF